MPETVELVCEADAAPDILLRLSEQLERPILRRATGSARFILRQTSEHLELLATGADAPGPVWVEFVRGKAAHRRRQNQAHSPLLKAVGLKKWPGLQIIDATAGLGRDAFMLAEQGCRVQMIEQSPIVHALLQDGLQRAMQHPETRAIAQRMGLTRADAISYLSNLQPEAYPQVVYLDPMYPHRDKSALSKKDMQLLQQLLGADRNGQTLLQQARRRCRQRVVVKRPARAGALAGTPAFHCASRNTRYDVYLPFPHSRNL